MQPRSVAVSLLLAGLLYAQNTAALFVTVLDPSGAVIPRAVIELTTGSGAHMSAITDDSGRATLAPIPAGRASIHVVADGFAPREQSVTLKPGENHWQAKLPIATRKDEVEVAMDKREELTDRNGNAFTTTLTPAQIDQLPDDPDEMEQVLKNMAGPGAAMRVDGFMGGRLPHKSQIASIRFRLSAYNAEDHDLGFNIVDITTKPGFGAWHGSALFGYGGDTFNARNFFAPVREPQQNRRVDLSLSGPLRRNKTSASLAFDKTFSYDSKTTVGVTPLGSFADLVRLPLDMSSFQARIQNSWHKTHVMRGEYQYYTQTRSNIGNFDRPDRLFSNGQSMNVLRLSDSGAVSEKVLNEVRFQTQWITSTAKSATQATAIVVPGAFSTGGAGFDSRREARETELRDDVSFNVKNHSLRVGLQFDAGRFHDRDTTNANGTFQFASLADYLAGHPLTFTQRVGNVPVNYDRYDFGGYIQDDLRLTKSFSLSAGVRWEAQTHVAGRNHFAPRAGFAWSPFKRAKTIIRGGGGIFYQWFGADIYEQTLRVNGFNQSDLVVVNPGYPNPFEGGALASQLPPSIYRRDPLLNLPYFLRTSLGVQQQISKLMLTVDARLEHGLHLLWADNLNAPLPGIGRPNPLAGNIFDIQSGATSNRKQLHVGLSSAPGAKGPPRRVLWFFNYVLTKQTDEVSSALLPPSNPFNLRADRGPSSMDARHRFFALANGTIGKGFQLGANFHSNSATPYNITTGFDNNGDTVINDRPAGVPRNSVRGSGLWDLSTRLSWTKGIGKPNGEGPPTMIMIRGGDTSGDIPTLPGQKPSKYQLQLYTQAYNVFNHANLSNYVGVLTSPLYGEPTSAGAGRRIELGIKFAF
jgi:carboxypeptidase family protein